MVQRAPLTFLIASLAMFVCLPPAAELGAATAAPDIERRAAETSVPPESGALQSSSAPALRGPVDEAVYIVGPGDRFSVTIWGQGVVTQSAVVTPEGELVFAGVETVPVAGRTLKQVKGDVKQRLERIYRDVSISVSLIGLRSMLVDVLGSVKDPGAYGCTAMDPASELIAKAGGFLRTSSRRNILMTDRNGGERRIDLVRYEQAGDLAANPPVLNGEVIFVPTATRFVHVYGSVARPGRYELVDGETLGSLIEIAGGFAEGAITDSVELRVYVDDKHTRSTMVDPSAESEAAVRLSDGDQVYVHQTSDWRPAEYVVVEGEVERPGPYGVTEGTDRLSDVIRRAGGLTEKASIADAYVERPPGEKELDVEYERLDKISVGEMTEMEYAYYRAVQRDRRSVVTDFESALAGDPSADVLLRDGDRIMVPRAVSTVQVMGQVADPGEVDWESGRGYGYYVRKAGGYSGAARRNRVMVIRRATGARMGAGSAGALWPGDTVWVPERTETDWWRVVRETAAFITSVVTAYVIIDQSVGK
ncbi:MAG: SLBB domain-containing protein [Candidatus Eisenbacteria bacterium]|nr:SLBB domain-containing protein [Candidatus Eisenbacteria bacterium]